uniref:Floricaula/leafy-like transcription factor n=1 Tax=Angiopteris lygodiifolia TaxID=3267 RepID=Q8S9D5_ANGLY|nr:LFY homolog [Angiopteris lygodiifolia]
MRPLEELFKDYGVRLTTIAKVMELGFTVSTLVNMTEQEIDDVIKTMLEGYPVELLMGEKYGFKSAIRAEKKRQEDEMEAQRLQLLSKSGKRRKVDESAAAATSMDGTPREQRGDNGMMFPDPIVAAGPRSLNTKEPFLLEQSHAHFGTPGLLAIPEPSSDNEGRKLAKKKQKRRLSREHREDGDDRPREHPFIVTEPGELARGKKNGLDYLFDLYEQCAKFLDVVQQISKERGEKCPTKVTNQVFRHAKLKGASYINKPKMRHYVHCFALHCLDQEKSNSLRKAFKERGENVGAWRQACYYPLVEMARANGWDIEGVFNRNEKLRIWYVPTKLRQLCHSEKSKDSDSCSYE